MKLIIIIYYKLKMMFRDRLFFGAMVIIPAFIAFTAGYALKYEDVGKIQLAIVDEDNSEYSKLLVSRLMQNESLKVITPAIQEAEKMLENSQIEASFIVKKGFMERIIEGDYEEIIDFTKLPSTFSAEYLREVMAGEVMRFIANSMAASWVAHQYDSLNLEVSEGLKQEVMEHADSQWEPEPLMTVKYYEIGDNGLKKVDRVAIPALTGSSAGIIIAFTMFFVLFNSSWLIEERNNETLKRLVSVSGALRLSFVGNALALFISGVLQTALFSLIISALFQVHLFPGPWSFVVYIAYLIFVVTLSLFITSVLKTPQQLQAGAPVFALLTGFMGGCFWNFAQISEHIKRISILTPQGLALEAINSLLSNPERLDLIISPVMVLFTGSLILLPLSYIIVKVRIDK